jgi:hypothetical protein
MPSVLGCCPQHTDPCCKAAGDLHARLCTAGLAWRMTAPLVAELTHLQCANAALTSFNYTSPNTGTTFVFNNTPVSSSAAQQQCQAYGGNLVSYMSLEEQQEVEALFIERGDLLPSYHESYWLGLYTPTLKPAQFNWADQLSGTLNWTHWGTYKWEGETAAEPNNLFGQESCGAANASQAFQDAFGWMDINCNVRMPFMCRVVSEWPWHTCAARLATWQ